MHDSADLIRLFNETFLDSHHTELVGGGDEPIYLPADGDHPHHRIVFTRNYFASALHEVAHWCIAGKERRQRVDYGYWYTPDGRSAGQQAEFERVEARPQAIEWLFSLACGSPFRISVDNLNGDPLDSRAFEARVKRTRRNLEQHGLPPRARQFRDVLARAYHSQTAFA